MNRIQVLIVDDHPLFRRGVRWGLEAEPDILVVGEATDGQTAVQQADLLVPDVVLIDINMPQMNGLEVTRIIRRRHPQTGVIVLTMHEDDEQLFHAIRVGAAAYCTKDAAAGRDRQVDPPRRPRRVPDQRERAAAAVRRIPGARPVPRALPDG